MKIQFTGRCDDFHHHLRDNEALKLTVSHAAKQFKRCLAMPNLIPPITTCDMALRYRERILENVPLEYKGKFEPLMTLYLTENISIEEIKKISTIKEIVGIKLYPAGATTNSDSGVKDIKNIKNILKIMEQLGIPLLIHGEVTNLEIDVFDREKIFIENILKPMVHMFPKLKIVLEHITTKEAVDFVMNSSENIGATITPQHLLYNRNAIFEGGLRPHKYCLPVLKHENHRKALLETIKSGNKKFFLGTDSAPHQKSKKENYKGCAGIYSAHAALELYAEAFESIDSLHLFKAFANENGANFYNLPIDDQEETVIVKEDWIIPESYTFENDVLIPLRAGEKIGWKKIK